MKKFILAIMFLVPLVSFGQAWEDDEVYVSYEQSFIMKTNDKFDDSVYMEIMDDGEEINGLFFRDKLSVMMVMNYDCYGKKTWRSPVLVSLIDKDKCVIHCKELNEHINNSNGYSTLTYISKDTQDEITLVIPCKYN